MTVGREHVPNRSPHAEQEGPEHGPESGPEVEASVTGSLVGIVVTLHARRLSLGTRLVSPLHRSILNGRAKTEELGAAR